MSKSNPIVLRLLPDRSHGPREVALAESADRDADQTRPQIGLPKHCRAAGRTEMVSDLSAFGSITHIGVVGAFGAKVLLLEIGADSEHRASSPLTLAAMTGDNSIGLARCVDLQGAASTMRSSRHVSPHRESLRRPHVHHQIADCCGRSSLQSSLLRGGANRHMRPQEAAHAVDRALPQLFRLLPREHRDLRVRCK